MKTYLSINIGIMVFWEEEKYSHIELPYNHLLVHQKGIIQYKKELLDICNQWPDVLTQEKTFLEILREIDDFPIMTRPFSSIEQYIIKNEWADNPYNIITKNFELEKKLINLLQYWVALQPIEKNIIFHHNHNRYIHSLDTANNIELILRKNNFSEKKIKEGIICGVLHDIATPILGDLTMKAFPELKEEKEFLNYMMNFPNIIEQIEKEFEISIKDLHQYIKNEWIIGKVLDIADRIAYTTRDVYLFGPKTPNQNENKYEKAIKQIIKKDPNINDIIMEISIENGQVIFENPERLKDLLLLRANMHNLIYLNHHLRAREEYFGLILSFLIKEWHLSFDNLQKGYDEEGIFINEERFFNIYKKQIIDNNPMTTYDFFETEICPNKQEALTRIQILQKENISLPIHYLQIPAFKTGINYLIRDQWTIKPLSEVLQEEEKNKFNELWQATNKHLILYPKKEYQKESEFYKFLYTTSKTI